MFHKILDHLEEWLISFLIAGATLLIFFAVIHRYGNGLSIDISKWAAAHGFERVAAVFLAIGGPRTRSLDRPSPNRSTGHFQKRFRR